MDLKWTRRLGMGLSLIALNAVGCAEERDPINRVQSDALSKDFFVGKLADPSDDPEFFWRNFVVDGSEAQSMVGIGSWSAVDRIRFEITENLLVARRAYEVSDGADGKGPVGKKAPDGLIVAAYPITKHFDVKRAYNPQTGEDLNIIEENTSDRVWNQRTHFRVDWSINIVDSPLWFDMFLGRIFGDIKVTPVAYYVNDPSHPDRPNFVPDQGYFDITNKFWVEPDSMRMWGMNVPTCLIMGLYTGSAVNSCDKQEAVVRSSFWKVQSVPSADDYEPLENTYANLDIIGNPGGLGSSYTMGIVTPPRVEWDPQYGYTDPGMSRKAHAHNIWQQSHQLRGSCQSDDQCGGGACILVPNGGGAKACTIPCNPEITSEITDRPGTNVQCAAVSSVVGQDGRVTERALTNGAQCSAKSWCTIPVRNRRIKTVGYWMNGETPAELTDPVDANGQRIASGTTEDMIESWNQLMRFSVAKAREVECRRTEFGNREQCRSLYFEAGDLTQSHEMVSYGAWLIEKPKLGGPDGLEDDVLVACHNPVRDYDHASCGKPGYKARVGDLRHNFLYYWPYASRAPWGGIANWNADPLSGMIVGASATTMGRSATYAAAMVRDIIMVANGELTFEDITDGTPAELYQRRLQDGRVPDTFTKEELNRRVDSIDPTHAAQQVAGAPLKGDNASQKLEELTRMASQTMAGLGPASTSHLEYDAIAEKVRGSVYEAQMVTPNWVLDAAGMNPKTTDLSEVMDVVSPLRGMDHARTEYLQQLIDLRMAARGVCFPDIYAENVGNIDVQGVSRFFYEKYSDANIKANMPEYSEADELTLSKKRAELIYTELWKETYKGIQLHEVGHSLGMLHQFASSYDSLNFLPQYWQLRTNESALTGEGSAGSAKNCQGNPQTDGNNCMGPRYLDPETDDELGQGAESRPGISYFAHTSTMEYQNERFFETVGLGQYDMLAMNVLYGRILQVFDPDHYSEAETTPFAYRNWTQLTEDNLVVWANPDLNKPIPVTGGPTVPASALGFQNAFLQGMHYTEQARRLKAFDPARCRDATAGERGSAQWRIVHGKVCAAPPKDYASWYDFENGKPGTASVSDDLLKWRVRPDARTAPGALRWPYRWGVTSNSYPHTNPSDAGADIYEVTKSTIEKFDYQYPFTYFRRQSRDWAYFSIPSRISRGFYERLRAFHWSMAIDVGRLGALVSPDEPFAVSQGYSPKQVDEINRGIYKILGDADDWNRPQAMASNDIFNAIVRAFLMPQIGSYGPCEVGPGQVRALLDSDCGNAGSKSLLVDASTGRYIDPDFEQGPYGGGSWDYQSYVNHAGYTFEKSDASRALTDGRAVFFTISRENYLDGRNVNVNFRTDMPDAIDRLLGGVLSGDFETIAPFVQGGSAISTAPIQITNLFGDNPTRPAGARLLFPNVGYKQQVGTLVFGHIFARLNGDLNLSNKMRIWVDGQFGEFNVPTAQQARFYNPESGFTYIARKYGDDVVDGRTVDKGIGSRMLRTANLILARAYEVQGGPNNPTLDSFGQVTVLLDANDQPILRSAYYLNQYRNFVGLLDASVQLANMVGYGPFNGWGSIDLD